MQQGPCWGTSAQEVSHNWMKTRVLVRQKPEIPYQVGTFAPETAELVTRAVRGWLSQSVPGGSGTKKRIA